MNNFRDLSLDIQILATAVEATQPGEAYAPEVVKSAGNLAGSIGLYGRELALGFNPDLGISDELSAVFDGAISSNKVSKPDLATELELLKSDLTDLDEPESEVKKWLKSTRLIRPSTGVVSASALLALVEGGSIELSDNEIAEAESAMNSGHNDIEAELKTDDLGSKMSIDSVLGLADVVFRLMLDYSERGVLVSKEDILRDERFINECLEIVGSADKRTARTSLTKSWDAMIEWFAHVDPEHEIFEKEGRARGRRYKLRDPEVLALEWMEPLIDNELEVKDELVKPEVVEVLEKVSSIDFLSGVIIFADRKVELGEPEKTILEIIGQARSQEISLGSIRNTVEKKFKLSKDDCKVAVNYVLGLVGNEVVVTYSKRKNKRMVKLKNPAN